jgi:hypothetical protein
MSVREYLGYKVSNDFLPMMARQMVMDHPEYANFFTFHDGAARQAVQVEGDRREASEIGRYNTTFTTSPSRLAVDNT